MISIIIIIIISCTSVLQYFTMKYVQTFLNGVSNYRTFKTTRPGRIHYYYYYYYYYIIIIIIIIRKYKHHCYYYVRHIMMNNII